MSKMFDIQDLVSPVKKLAKASKAQLGGVACFVVKNDTIVSSGVNYNPTGEPMECEVDGKLVSRSEVIHAEVAAFQAAANNGIDITDATLVLNMSPCIKCAQEIVNAGINEVCYVYEWWDKAALDVLHEAGIKTQKLEEKK